MSELPQQLSQFVGPIGFSLAVGFFLDRIIEPKRLPTPKPSNNSENFFSNLEHTYSSLFSGFFGARFLSLKYWLSVASVSVPLFVVIYLFQSLALDSRKLSHLSAWTAAATAFAILSNIAIDAVSFRITRAFLLFGASAKNFPNLCIVMLSDFVLTLAAFTYSAAAFITLLITITFPFANKAIEEQVFDTILYVEKRQKESEVEYSIVLKIEPEPDETQPHRSRLLLRAQPDEKIGFMAISSLGDFVKLDNARIETLGEQPQTVATASIETLDDGNTVFNFEDMHDKFIDPEFSHFKVVFGGGLRIQLPIFDRTWLSSAFSTVNDVESQVFKVISGAVSDKSIGEISGLQMGYSPFVEERICFTDFVFGENSTSNFEVCEIPIYAIHGIVHGPISEFLSWIKPLFSAFVPISTMLLTSLFFTATMYIAVLGTALSQLAKSRIATAIPRCAFYFSKAPFSFSSLIFGTTLSTYVNFFSG